MPVGQTVVPYAMFQEAFQSNPDQLLQRRAGKSHGSCPGIARGSLTRSPGAGSLPDVWKIFATLLEFGCEAHNQQVDHKKLGQSFRKKKDVTRLPCLYVGCQTIFQLADIRNKIVFPVTLMRSLEAAPGCLLARNSVISQHCVKEGPAAHLFALLASKMTSCLDDRSYLEGLHT